MLTPVAKRNRLEQWNLSNRAGYFRSLNSRPIDFHGGFKDHNNQPKILQGITNLPEKHGRVAATWIHVQTCRAEPRPRPRPPATTCGVSRGTQWARDHGPRHKADSKFCDPLNRAIFSFPLRLFSGGGRGLISTPEQRDKPAMAWSVLFLQVLVCSLFGEMAILASGWPSVKAESFLAQVLSAPQREDCWTIIQIFVHLLGCADHTSLCSPNFSGSLGHLQTWECCLPSSSDLPKASFSILIFWLLELLKQSQGLRLWCQPRQYLVSLCC